MPSKLDEAPKAVEGGGVIVAPPPPPPQPARRKAEASRAASGRRACILVMGFTAEAGGRLLPQPREKGARQEHGRSARALQSQPRMFAQQVEMDLGKALLRQPHV